MRKRFLILLLILLGIGTYLYFHSYPWQQSNSIRLSGNIEITEVDLSFKIPGRVEKRLVDEGDRVKEGEIVAILDSSDLEHEVAVQEAQVQAYKAALAEILAGYLPEEIHQASDKVIQAQAELNRLEIDIKRQQRLFEKDVISAREYDNSRTAYNIAQSKYQEASQQLMLLQKGYRPEKRDQAAAQLQQAEQSLALAKVKLGYATLYAPSSGTVLSKNVEPGEYVSPGTPIVTIGDLDYVWMRGYINETELGKIKLGQKVDVTTDTYPGKIYEGVVVFISPEAEFTPKNVQTEKERVKLVYRIKVDINNFHHELKPGMPADGMINLNP